MSASTHKLCPSCGVVKPLSDFYATAIQTGSYCKCCHNAKCVARVRGSRTRRAQQYRTKRAWNLVNPLRKAVHEKRSIFLQADGAPASLRQLDALRLTLASNL